MENVGHDSKKMMVMSSETRVSFTNCLQEGVSSNQLYLSIQHEANGCDGHIQTSMEHKNTVDTRGSLSN